GHLGIEAAFLREVAPGLPRQLAMVLAAEADRPRVGAQHHERDAPRGLLAGAVRAQESEDVRLGNLEREPGKGCDGAESLFEPVDGQRHGAREHSPGVPGVPSAEGPVSCAGGSVVSRIDRPGRCRVLVQNPQVMAAQDTGATTPPRIHADRAAGTLELEWQDGHRTVYSSHDLRW